MCCFSNLHHHSYLCAPPKCEFRLKMKMIFQETTLLDSEITDQIHRLELTGTPSASLPEDLVDFPHSPEATELCCDSNLRVTLQKVWTPHELVLVFFLTNQNQASAPICDVSSVLEPPSNLIALFGSSPTNKFQDDSIEPHEWVRTLSKLIIYSVSYCFSKQEAYWKFFSGSAPKTYFG